jgi:hypothetical protein
MASFDLVTLSWLNPNNWVFPSIFYNQSVRVRSSPRCSSPAPRTLNITGRMGDFDGEWSDRHRPAPTRETSGGDGTVLALSLTSENRKFSVFNDPAARGTNAGLNSPRGDLGRRMAADGARGGQPPSLRTSTV